jgi:mannitol-1-/sugar-/sorbitol-6-phosphatase
MRVTLLSCSVHITTSALLFDLDGVLTDSTPAVERVWRHWAIEHGIDPEEAIHKAHGRPSIATVREYLPNADHEAENLIIEQREMEDLEGVVPLPGAIELLNQLPPERWAIVTSCTRPLAEVRIRFAGLPLPKCLLTSSDIIKGKPDPEPYIKGAALLGLKASQCVVLEDVPAGIRAGKAAGAPVIALRTTSPESQLKAAGADWILDNCSAISFSGVRQDHKLTLELREEMSRRTTANANSSPERLQTD